MKYYFLALGTVVVVCVGCAMDGHQHTGKGEYHAPPAAMMQRPGPMVDGPGPGVIPGMGGMGGMMGGPPGGMMGGPPGGMMAGQPMAPSTTQVRFVGPDGMHIGWQIPGGYAENQLVAPARYNFFQGATYRLKVTNVPGREGLALYPTLMIYPGHPNTEAYLSHNSVPLQMNEEDLDQIESNNFVTKVIYLPDARYQELAIANVETLVSTRLDPGVDPIQDLTSVARSWPSCESATWTSKCRVSLVRSRWPDQARVDSIKLVIRLMVSRVSCCLRCRSVPPVRVLPASPVR